MNVLWISANKLGFETFKSSQSLFPKSTTILTLSSDSTTVMYDGVSTSSWDQFGFPVVRIRKISESFEIINKINPDIVIMCGWRQRITKDLLDIPKMGWIGFHPTMLPKGRGSAPIINSILKGWNKSGLTMFYLTERLDDGDIIGQQPFEIDKNDHASDVYDKVIKSGQDLAKKYFPLLFNGEAPRKPQSEKEATFFDKPLLRNNMIDLDSEPLETAFRKIKAFSSPYNGAFIRKGKEKIIIWRAQLETLQE